MDDKDFLKLPSEIDLPNTIEGRHDLIRCLLRTVSELFKRIKKLEIENKDLKERLLPNLSTG